MDNTARIATALESIAASLEKLANPQALVKLTQEEFTAKTIAKKPVKRKQPDHNPKYTDEFLEFWSVYPRQVAKPDAYKAWNQVEESRPDDIIAKAKLYAQSVRSTENKFIKYPATWLRNHCWEDDISSGRVVGHTGGVTTINISRIINTESIEHYSDPLWPEYKKLVQEKEIEPGFIQWKEAHARA